jgi:hypothetical protein
MRIFPAEDIEGTRAYFESQGYPLEEANSKKLSKIG